MLRIQLRNFPYKKPLSPSKAPPHMPGRPSSKALACKLLIVRNHSSSLAFKLEGHTFLGGHLGNLPVSQAVHGRLGSNFL